MTAYRFDGKTAIVTGAAGDIGRAACQRLSREGAAVLAVDIDGHGLDETLALVEQAGGQAQAHVADVTDVDAVKSYVSAARALRAAPIDVFFNNAGVEGPAQPIDEYSERAWDDVMGVNAKGVFLGLKYVSAAMRSGGAIVNTASVAGVVGFGTRAAYVASKHAVIGLTRCAALDLGPRGIRVNAICPGPVQGRMMTAIEERIDPERGRRICDRWSVRDRRGPDRPVKKGTLVYKMVGFWSAPKPADVEEFERYYLERH